MKEYRKVFILWIATIAVTVGFSFSVTTLFYEKPEGVIQAEPVISSTMTLKELAQKNRVNPKLLKKIFSLSSPSDLDKEVGSFKMDPALLHEKIKGAMALKEEDQSKNWIKIPVKFALWILFMVLSFYLLRKKKITEKTRPWLYGAAVVIFGVILGADPSPMGTVKDALVLYGNHKVIFPPRMIAFSIFLATVIVANKFICSWGCQFGTLQDFIFRINKKKKSSLLPRYKVPFRVTMTVRTLFFILIVVTAFIFIFDLVGVVDPFKIFKPKMIGITGGIFLIILLLASLVVYRPWCTFFCPFGFIGWFGEKISIFNIKVDYDACIACEKCVASCPSTVMESYLKQDRVKPDCFSCGSCIESCPTGAITFSAGKRSPVPPEKFK